MSGVSADLLFVMLSSFRKIMSDLTTRNGLSYSHLAWSSLNSSSSSSSSERSGSTSAASVANPENSSGKPVNQAAAAKPVHEVAHLDVAAFPAVWDYPWISSGAAKLAREARRSIESSQLVVGLIAQRECALHAQSTRNIAGLPSGLEADLPAPVAPRNESRLVADRLQRMLQDAGHCVADFVSAMWRDIGSPSKSSIAPGDAQAAQRFALKAPQAEAQRRFAVDVDWLHSALQALQDQASAIMPGKRLDNPCNLVSRTLEAIGAYSALGMAAVQADTAGQVGQSAQASFASQSNQAGSGSHSSASSSGSASPLLAMTRFV